MAERGARVTAKANLLSAFALAVAALVWPGFAMAQPAAPTAGLESPQWTLFSDPLGTRVDYPENIFPVDAGPAPRGTGRTLRSRDDRTWLMVYVEDNEQHHTPASFVRAFLTAPRDRVEYNRISDRFFAISEGARTAFISLIRKMKNGAGMRL